MILDAHCDAWQALAMITRHGPFSAAGQAAVLGGTMAHLLARRQA